MHAGHALFSFFPAASCPHNLHPPRVRRERLLAAECVWLMGPAGRNLVCGSRGLCNSPLSCSVVPAQARALLRVWSLHPTGSRTYAGSVAYR